MGDAALPVPVPAAHDRVVLLYSREIPPDTLAVLATKFPDADFEYHRVERDADLPGG